jgi:hypothetical protein
MATLKMSVIFGRNFLNVILEHDLRNVNPMAYVLTAKLLLLAYSAERRKSAVSGEKLTNSIA